MRRKGLALASFLFSWSSYRNSLLFCVVGWRRCFSCRCQGRHPRGGVPSLNLCSAEKMPEKRSQEKNEEQIEDDFCDASRRRSDSTKPKQSGNQRNDEKD